MYFKIICSSNSCMGWSSYFDCQPCSLMLYKNTNNKNKYMKGINLKQKYQITILNWDSCLTRHPRKINWKCYKGKCFNKAMNTHYSMHFFLHLIMKLFLVRLPLKLSRDDKYSLQLWRHIGHLSPQQHPISERVADVSSLLLFVT